SGSLIRSGRCSCARAGCHGLGSPRERSETMRQALMFVLVGCAASAASAQVLVFDENSNNHYGQQGAGMAGLGAVTVATSSNFNTLLTDGTAWKAVAVDCPSSFPSDNWAGLASYMGSHTTPVV